MIYANDNECNPLSKFHRLDASREFKRWQVIIDLRNVNGDAEAVDGTAAADEADRLPSRMRVNTFDLACYVSSVLFYMIDVLLDVAVGCIHFFNERYWAAAWVIALIVLPSLIVNFIAGTWWVDDAMKARSSFGNVNDSANNGQTPKLKAKLQTSTLRLRLLSCIFQLSPVVCYLEVIHYALQYRRVRRSGAVNDEAVSYYSKMAAVERDASLLRLLEVFLEALPQLLIQGLVLADECRAAFHTNDAMASVEGQIVKWQWIVQLMSISFSLLSASWAVVSQHRTLRVSLPTKDNLGYLESILQLIWRFCTISSRYICMILFAMAVPSGWFIGAFFVHFILSLVHICALQNIQFKSTFGYLNTILIFINAVIHLFTPFNMTEGSTRLQYLVAYTIELSECLGLLAYCILLESFHFSMKMPLAGTAIVLFIIGVGFMLFYYRYLHPRLSIISSGHATHGD